MIDNRHFAKAVALLQRSEQVLPSVPGFQHCDLAGFEDEHRIGLVVFAEKVLVRRDGHERTHPEQELEDVAQRYPARHYVLVDDKLRILTAVKSAWKGRVTTVFVRQGHYALDAAEVAKYPAADVTIERIGDLLHVDRGALVPSPA